MSSPAVTKSATLSTVVIRSRIAAPLTSKRDSTRSVRAVLGTLPLASRRTTVQSIVRAKPCTRLPPVLVAAANSKSVPTAVAGWTPNNRMSSGVMSDPPPTQVIPTNRPPTNPQTEYSGSIACMAGFRLLVMARRERRHRRTRKINLKTAKAPAPGSTLFDRAGLLQPLAQLRPATTPRDAAYRDGDGFLLANQNDKPLTAGNAGIEQVALQHGVVLRHDRDHNGWIFRALALMDGRGVGRHQGVEFAKAIGDRASVEPGDELAVIRLNVLHVADVAVVDLLVVVVLDLHDFVAGREGPAEPLDLAFARRVQRRLKFNVKGARADAASVHRAEHLDIADWIETEAARDAGFHKLNDARNCGLGIGRLDKIEVAFGFRYANIGYDTLVDAMRIHNDPAFGGLAEDLGQANNGNGTTRDHVGQDLAGADRRQLINITDQEQGCFVGDCLEQRMHQQHVHHRGFVDNE